MPVFSKIGSRHQHPVTATSVLQLSITLLFALLLTFPCVRQGVTSGYDSATHTRYQHHFSEQFWHGDLYPRWLARENKGYGSPIFLIQYPLPYFVTAMLRPLTSFPHGPDREARELGIFIFISLATAGIAARYWFGKFSAPLAATFAALAYMALPYFVVAIYLRAAVGEISALIFMPLSLAFAESISKDKRAIFPLGASFALLVLSNLIVSLLFVPVLFLYTLSTESRTGPALFITARRVLWALVLAVGLSSVYLVPVIAYRGMFHLDGMTNNLPDFELGRYFLYLTSGALDRRNLAAMALSACLAVFAGWNLTRLSGGSLAKLALAVALLLGMSALPPGVGEHLIASSNFQVTSFAPFQNFLAVMLVTFSATMSLGIVTYCRPVGCEDPRQRALVAVACVAFLLMLPISAPLWKAVPSLGVIQFPFRFGSILALAVAGLLASSLDRIVKEEGAARHKSLAICGTALFCVIGMGAMTCRIDEAFSSPRGAVQYSEAQDLDVMYRTYVPAERLEAFADSIGTKPSTYFAVAKPGDGVFTARFLDGAGKVEVRRENPRRISVSADCQGGARLLIGQLYFPLWKKVSQGRAAPDSAVGASPEGLLELSLAPGEHKFLLVFDAGFAERLGFTISAVSILIALAGYLYPAFKPKVGRS